MSQLILGTAEFNKDGYAGKPCPSEKEIVRILNLAWEGGIRTLDCADSYNTEWVEKYFGGFDRIYKSRNSASSAAWYHYRPGEAVKVGIARASVYDIEQLAGLRETIVPFNINNVAFGNVLFLNSAPIIRSIFDRGRLLEQGYTVRDCLSFVARHHNSGAIVGVNSAKELQEILTAWGSINGK
jgi:hypothetical protein